MSAPDAAANLELLESFPWVVYHYKEEREARFWSDEDGWTSLEGATRYLKAPDAEALPFGGSDCSRAVPVCIGSMKFYVVEVCEVVGWRRNLIDFECFAEDDTHALDQARNAYPMAHTWNLKSAEDAIA